MDNPLQSANESAVTANRDTSPVPSIRPGLMVVHGNRLEDLRDLLLAWLAGPRWRRWKTS